MVPDRFPRSYSRRAFLGASAAALPVALAGCSSSCPDTDPPTPSTVVRPDDEPSGPLSATAVQGTWPTFRHDQYNTGFGRNATPPGKSPTLAWRTEIAAPQSPSAPVLVDGRLYVIGGDGNLHALDARDGTEQWHIETVPARQAPTVDPDTGLLVVAGEDGIVAVDLPGSSGRGGGSSTNATEPSVRWRADQTATASIVSGTNRVFVPVEDELRALTIDTGEVAWHATFDGPVTRPALAGDTVLAAAAHLRAVATSDGSEHWQAGLDGISGFPVVDPEAALVYLGGYEGLTAINLASGQTAWQFERGGGRGYSAPVVTPETLYAIERVGEGPDAIYALTPDTGSPKPRWCSRLGQGTVSAAGSRHVLVETSLTSEQPADGNVLQAFRRDTGEATWQFRSTSEVLAPALGHGTAFVVTGRGTVCALGNGGDGS